MCLNILQVLDVVSNQGHSGFSFGYFFSILKRVMNYKPITPILNIDGEWEKSSFDNSFVHKRCSQIYKTFNEETKEYEYFDTDGRYFINPDSSCYKSKESEIKITFPYSVPDKPEYVKVDEEGNIIGKYYFIKARMSTGYGILMDINGKEIDFSYMPKGFKISKLKNMKRISARSSCIVDTIKI